MARVDFHFDYLSPYAYLAWFRVREICASHGAELSIRPVLLAALLDRWGQLGPAEIPPKRAFVLKDASRIAARRGLPLTPPVRHPFNPLAALRVSLAEASGELQPRVVDAIFRAGWGEGADIGDAETLARVLERADLPAAELLAKTGDPAIKAALRTSTEQAVARGVFGVPTMLVGDELLWGDDQMQSLSDVLAGTDPIDARAMDAAVAANAPSVVRKRRS